VQPPAVTLKNQNTRAPLNHPTETPIPDASAAGATTASSTSRAAATPSASGCRPTQSRRSSGPSGLGRSWRTWRSSPTRARCTTPPGERGVWCADSLVIVHSFQLCCCNFIIPTPHLNPQQRTPKPHPSSPPSPPQPTPTPPTPPTSALTENTRASYPISYIDNARIPCVGPHPRNVILLCCDAFGVLPPVSKLTLNQAMYHFISCVVDPGGLVGAVCCVLCAVLCCVLCAVCCVLRLAHSLTSLSHHPHPTPPHHTASPPSLSPPHHITAATPQRSPAQRWASRSQRRPSLRATAAHSWCGESPKSCCCY